jgi:anti-sigma factor RsiW
MTEPIEPHELSGLLDGELTSQRAKEVRRSMEDDPKLLAEFERLQRFDNSWSAAASAAAFEPEIILPPQRNGQAGLFTGIVPALCVLLAARFLAKLDSTFTISVAVHLVLLLLIIAALIRINGMADPPSDRRGLVRLSQRGQ